MLHRTPSGTVTRRGRWTVVRVFISSTFVDTQGERDALIKTVLPQINRRLRDQWISVVFVDLRWGLMDEQAQRIIQTCLNEMDRCRSCPDSLPWFIGLRTERCGYIPQDIPKPEELNQPDNAQWLSQLDLEQCIYPITSYEVMHAFLENTSYVNHGPRAFCYFRDPAFKKDCGVSMRWLFDFEYLSDNSDGVEEPQQYKIVPQEQWRKITSGFDLVNRRIREKSDVCVSRDYTCAFDSAIETGKIQDRKMGAGWVKNIEKFTSMVTTDLGDAISSSFMSESSCDLTRDNLLWETEQHLALAETRAEGALLLRKPLLHRMQNFLDRENDFEDSNILVVHGKAGSGKSSLMAQFIVHHLPFLNCPTIYHIVGCSGSSVSLRSTLLRLLFETNKHLQHSHVDIDTPQEQSIGEIAEIWRAKLIFLAAECDKVVVVVDAVNEITYVGEDTHRYFWIPLELPCNVRIILSCTQDHVPLIIPADQMGILPTPPPSTKIPPPSLSRQDFSRSQSTRKANFKQLAVSELEDFEKKCMICEILSRHHKKLCEDSNHHLGNQMQILISKSDSSSPLYLVVAIEQLLQFGVYEQLSSYLTHLPSTTTDLFAFVLRDLEESADKRLVSVGFTFMVSARSGLFEQEVQELIMNHFSSQTDRMTIPSFSLMHARIRPFLAGGTQGILRLFHGNFLKHVQERYNLNSKSPMVLSAHKELAAFFEKKMTSLDEEAETCFNEKLRFLMEIPWQLQRAESREKLRDFISKQWVFEEMYSSEVLRSELSCYWIWLEETFNVGTEYTRVFNAAIFDLQNITDESKEKILQFGLGVAKFLLMMCHWSHAEALLKETLMAFKYKYVSQIRRSGSGDSAGKKKSVCGTPKGKNAKKNAAAAAATTPKTPAAGGSRFGWLVDDDDEKEVIVDDEQKKKSSKIVAPSPTTPEDSFHFSDKLLMAKVLETTAQSFEFQLKPGIFDWLTRALEEVVKSNIDTPERWGMEARLHCCIGKQYLYTKWEEIKEDTYANAEVALERARELWVKIGDEGGIATAMLYLGLLRRKQLRFEDGKNLMVTCLEKRINVFGSSHPEISFVYNELGSFFADDKNPLKNFHLAHTYFTNALKIRRACLGDHVLVATTLSYLAKVEPQPEAALRMAREALDIRTRNFAKDHFLIVSSQKQVNYLEGRLKKIFNKK